jgi:hypothetical protein
MLLGAGGCAGPNRFAQPTVSAPPEPATPWPPEAGTGATAHVVTPAEADMDVPLLRVPDGFTFTVAPEVTEIHWRVGRLEVGRSCTIDLGSGARGQPGGAGPGADAPRTQAPLGVAGAPGGRGGDGASGRSGASFELIAREVVPRGGLWIRTDGGPAGPGGAGGRGQPGGASSCDPPTAGGRGGAGGAGGRGGDGGATSAVRIWTGSRVPIVVAACATACTAASRPVEVGGDDGTIAIAGAPGCPGKGGSGGPPGPGDQSVPVRNCIRFPFGVERVPGGEPGAPGTPGQDGAAGACLPAVKLGGREGGPR